jgi:hypothetical protein
MEVCTPWCVCRELAAVRWSRSPHHTRDGLSLNIALLNARIPMYIVA